MSDRSRDNDGDDLYLPPEPLVIKEGLEKPDDEWTPSFTKKCLAWFTACQRRIKGAIEGLRAWVRGLENRVYHLERDVYRIQEQIGDDARDELRRMRDGNHRDAQANGDLGQQSIIRILVLLAVVWAAFGTIGTQWADDLLQAVLQWLGG